MARKEVPDEVAASLAIGWAQVKERESVYLVSDGVDAESAKKLGVQAFCHRAGSFDGSFERKRKAGPGHCADTCAGYAAKDRTDGEIRTPVRLKSAD